MAVTNLERRIRFSNLSREDYGTLADAYTKKLIPVLMENTEFVATLEAKGTHVMSKHKLEQEASKLSAHSDPSVASCGKAILRFLAGGVQTIDDVLITITSVILAGGIVLSTCITTIIGFILYAVTVCPAAVLIAALAKQYESLGQIMDNPEDPNIYAYKTLTTNIMSKPKGVSDVHELSKMVNVAESVKSAIECDATVPNGNPVAHECCSILRAIDERIGHAVQNNSSVTALAAFEMQLYSDLAPTDYTYNNSTTGSVMESVDFGEDDGTDLYMAFENFVGAPLLSSEGLLHGIICSVTNAANKKTILEFLNRYKDTVKYEFTHEAYSDIPILGASNAMLNFVADRCKGNAEIMESVQYLDQALAGIVDEAYDEVAEDAAQGGAPVVCANPSTTETGFNPDPYNIGSLTPFPVASRKVGSVLCDICRAETDEEITESMLNLGRISTVISESYTVEGDDVNGYMFMESNVGKVARRASDKAHQKFSKDATKDKTGGVKEAIKRTIDPMEKFIQKQYDTIKEKDANERRNVILKGGAMPKVLRWVKRGIGLLAGATVGQVIPAAAIVTGIVFLGYIASDKYLDHKERAKLLRELEDEIQICNEKIDDSRGDDNKQNKYELMRIRNQLTRTSEKIRLGLKY